MIPRFFSPATIARITAFRTMSLPTSPTFFSSLPKDEQQEKFDAPPSVDSRALPAPDTTTTTKLDVSGDGSTVKLDHLGPLVVNVDGTVSRIGNWADMADVERENTLRILGKRNKQRLEALQAKGQNQGP